MSALTADQLDPEGLDQPTLTGGPWLPESQRKAPSLGETLYSALHLQNLPVSAYDYVTTQDARNRAAGTAVIDPSFDAIGYAEQHGMAEHANSFVDARNLADADVIRRRIEDERAMQDVLSRSGGWGVAAQIGAGLLDPINLIPLGDAFKGGNLLRQAAKVGAEAAVTTGLDEAGLHTTQETRTAEESYWNMAGAAAFGGLLGASVGALKARVGEAGLAKAQARFTEELKQAGMDWQGGGSLSSASAGRATTLEQEALAPALGLEKLQAQNPVADDPIARTRASPSVEVRRISGDLAETPLYLKGNEEGIASPVAAESLVKQWLYPLARNDEDMRSAWVKYAKRVKDEGGAPIGYGEFREEVSKAGRRADAHAIPEVSEAVKAARRRIIDPLGDAAKAAKLLDEDVEVTTAESYWPRLYDKDLISADRNAFIKRLADQFEIDQIRSEEKATRAELEGLAEDVTNRILGSADGRLPYDLDVGARGSLKERTLNVPDAVVEPWLVNDAARVLRTYARTMAADTELTRVFGSPDLKDAIARINADYDKLQRRASGEEQAALQKRRARDVSDIEAIRDRIRGLYAIPKDPTSKLVRAGRFARNLNFARMLGGMTVSSIPDVGSAIMTHGLGRVMGTGAQALLGKLSRTAAFQMATEEVRLTGTALDMILHTRMLELNDVFADMGRYSKAERGLEWLTAKMGRVTLMDHWNTAMKQLAGLSTQTRMLQAIEKGEKASRGELRRLAMQGIDAEMAGRIRKEFRKHGVKDGGIWAAGTEAWADKEAARVFRAGLGKEVDRIIVTPGQEKPLWMSAEWGKTLGQFKSFVMSSMSRTLIHALQQRDANVLQGFVSMTALGMLSVWLKAQLKKPEDRRLPTNGAQWIAAGVDASGVASWFFEANNLAQRNLGVGFAVAPQRYAARTDLESIGGPTAGLVSDSITLAGHGIGSVRHATGTADDKTAQITTADIGRIRRLIPLNNVFYARSLFDRMQEAGEQAVGP